MRGARLCGGIVALWALGCGGGSDGSNGSDAGPEAGFVANPRDASTDASRQFDASRDEDSEGDLACNNSLDCARFAQEDRICDVDHGRCVQCLRSVDCPEDHDCMGQRCEPFVRCDNSLGCSPPDVCDSARERCVECVTAADCDGAPCVGSLCRTACVSDNQCVPLGLLCDHDAGHCVECVRDRDCGDQRYCEHGACLSSQCVAGTSRCRDDALVACADDGSELLSPVPCGGDHACVQTGDQASCEPFMCTPGTTACVSRTELVSCSDDGLRVLSSVDCSNDGTLCVEATCQDYACVPSETYCDDGNSWLCDSQGMDATLVGICVEGEFCDDATGLCTPHACEPDAVLCDDNAVVTCNAEGSGFLPNAIDCGSDQCVSGGCLEGLLFEDFEDGDLDGWTPAPTRINEIDKTYTNVDTVAADGTARAVRIDVRGLVLISDYATLRRDFSPSTPSTLRFFARAASTTTLALVNFDLHLAIGFDEDGSLYGVGQTPPVYQANRWYHFEARNIDWGLGTYDAYVDGELEATAVPFGNPTDGNLTRVSLGVKVGQPGELKSAFFDEIEIF